MGRSAVKRTSHPGRVLQSGVMAGLVILMFATMLAGTAKAENKSLEAVAAEIASAYNVEVLRSNEVTLEDGTRAYELVVMNRGGDYNEAFQVTRLLADPNTGGLMPAFRHGDSGYDLSGAPRFNPGRDGADYNLRRDSLR